MSGAADQMNGRGVRITLPGIDQLSPEQRRVFDDMVRGPRGVVIGPIRAVIHSPELADRWQKLGEYVRYRTVFPEKLSELAILTTARRWNSNVEWTIHRRIAEGAGLDSAIIDALRDGRVPDFGEEEMSEIYAFTREMQMSGTVSDDVYLPVKARWGEQGVVELTAIVGYYTMVAMMLNTHHVPLPDGLEPGFGAETASPDRDLSPIPAP